MRDEIMLRGEAWEGAVVVDMACYAELTSLARFRSYVMTQTRGRERAFLLAVIEHSVEGAESPQETRLRRIWTGPAGLVAPQCNRNVYDANGRFIGRPDLLDVEAGVVGEYDGDHHRSTAARRRDLEREDSFRACGLEYFSVVAGEMHDESAVASRILAACARADASSRPRTWTLVPHASALPDLSLDERIELRFRHRLPLPGPGFAVAGGAQG